MWLPCRIFGGAKLDLISKGDQKLTFKDIEGIDQVKEEIRELVEFLKNPKKFIDLGARSPAGVLLVGAPGTGMLLPLRHALAFRTAANNVRDAMLQQIFCDVARMEAASTTIEDPLCMPISFFKSGRI